MNQKNRIFTISKKKRKRKSTKPLSMGDVTSTYIPAILFNGKSDDNGNSFIIKEERGNERGNERKTEKNKERMKESKKERKKERRKREKKKEKEKERKRES